MASSTDLVLARLDRSLVRTLAVIPLQLSERGERLLLAFLVVSAALLTLLPPGIVRLPARVVHLADRGWVDAESVPGLPAAARDGDRLVLAVVGAPAAQVAPDAEPAPPAHALAIGRKVSLNQASQAELEALPGVGPALASRIIAARPFRSVEALDRVKGIGAKTLKRLSPLVEPG